MTLDLIVRFRCGWKRNQGLLTVELRPRSTYLAEPRIPRTDSPVLSRPLGWKEVTTDPRVRVARIARRLKNKLVLVLIFCNHHG